MVEKPSHVKQLSLNHVCKIGLSTGCSLFRAEGFSCSLGVLYGGLGINKFQFLIKKIEIKFPAINRIHQSEVRIRGSGSAPKCHGSPTLLKFNMFKLTEGQLACRFSQSRLLCCRLLCKIYIQKNVKKKNKYVVKTQNDVVQATVITPLILSIYSKLEGFGRASATTFALPCTYQGFGSALI